MNDSPLTTRIGNSSRQVTRVFNPLHKLVATKRVLINKELKSIVARSMGGIPESTLRGWCKNPYKICSDAKKFVQLEPVRDKESWMSIINEVLAEASKTPYFDNNHNSPSNSPTKQPVAEILLSGCETSSQNISDLNVEESKSEEDEQPNLTTPPTSPQPQTESQHESQPESQSQLESPPPDLVQNYLQQCQILQQHFPLQPVNYMLTLITMLMQIEACFQQPLTFDTMRQTLEVHRSVLRQMVNSPSHLMVMSFLSNMHR